MIVKMKSEAYQILIKVLEDSLGIVVLDKEQGDFAISDYIYDSIMFIQFILAIEERLGIELLDDFLDIELLKSANGFSEKLEFCLKSLNNANQ